MKILAYPSVRTEEKPLSGLAVFAVLFSLVIIVFLFSYFIFSSQSLRLDEAQSLWQTSRSPMRILQIVAEDVHVPLYHLILHFWQYLFGNAVETARLLSLAFFVLSLPLMYLLAELVLGRKNAIFTTALVAFSPFLNWYGNEVRMYSLFFLLTILNHYFFVRILKDGKEENPFIWTGYVVSAVLGIFTHYFFVIYCLVQAIFYFTHRKMFPRTALVKFLISAGLVILVFSPWLYFVGVRGFAAHSQPLLFAPTSINLFNTFSEFLFGFQSDHLNAIILSLWPLLVLFGFLALREGARIPSEVLYFLFSAFFPIIFIFVVSVLWRPLYLTRYLVFTLPAFFMVIVWFLSVYQKKFSFVLKIGLIFIMLSTLSVEAMSPGTRVKEDYKAVVSYLEMNAKATDSIAVSAPFTIYPFEYYYRGEATLFTLPLWNRYASGPVPGLNEDILPQEVRTITDGRRELWLVTSYDQGYEKALFQYLDSHFQKKFEREFSKGLRVTEYLVR